MQRPLESNCRAVTKLRKKRIGRDELASLSAHVYWGSFGLSLVDWLGISNAIAVDDVLTPKSARYCAFERELYALLLGGAVIWLNPCIWW